MARIAVIGDFDPRSPTHAATDAALGHASAQLGPQVEHDWAPTDSLSDELYSRCNGVFIAPGSPYRDMERVLAAIRYARERCVPCIGTCGGFQHMVLEYARNVLGLGDAAHAEYHERAERDPGAAPLFIGRLACSLYGRAMQLRLAPGSQVAACYGASNAEEQYYCSFGVNPEYVPLLRGGALRVSGSDAEGEVRIVELPGHPFFVGTLFVPQARSTSGAPHPLIVAFVRAVLAAASA